MVRMKKQSGGTKTEGRSARAAKTVEEYFSSVPEPARSELEKLRALIQSSLPPSTTEVISYAIPAFKGKKVLVWYAAFKGHCSLFPTAAVIEQFKDELEGYVVSKGTVQFPLGKRLPTSLIRKLVKARLAQSEAKAGT